MAKITNSIYIDAPLKKVFEYHSDPSHNPEYWPSFVEVSNIQSLPSGGTKYNWVYKMGGVKLEGTTTTTEFIPNQRIVTKTEGGIKSTFAFTYQTEGAGTRLSIEVEYSMPVPVLGKLAESFILRLNEREAQTVLFNLKDLLEA